MKKYQVTVNGNVYEVEVEELGGSFSAAVPSVPAASTTSAVPSAPKTVPASVPANAAKVGAPMPGKIVSVKVNVGQTVKEGDLVAVLEAMKMENEIFAPKAGTIASVNVSTGAMVETNDVIVTIN